MNTILSRTLLAVALAAVAAAAAAQTDPATAVECSNSGKRAIVAVYSSPPDRKDWSDDMLGKGTLKPGKSAKLKLKAKPDGCKADFSALLDNGDTVVKAGVDLCATSPAVEF
jgi:hypothetical protein